MEFSRENSYDSIKYQEIEIYNCLKQNVQTKYFILIMLKNAIIILKKKNAKPVKRSKIFT